MLILDNHAAHRRQVLAFAGAATKGEMTKALTITPDIWTSSATTEDEARRIIESVCRSTIQELNLALALASGVKWSKREAKRLTGVDLMGFYELRACRHGPLYPHAHLVIHLSDALVPAAEAFFIDRIGLKTKRDGIEVFTPRQGERVSRYLGSRSHVYLKDMHDMNGWSSYCMKHVGDESKMILPDQS